MKTNKIFWLCLIVIGIILDLFTKYLITSHFAYAESLPIFSGFNLFYVRNTGAAFSFLAEYAFAKYVFSLLAVIVSIVLLNWLFTCDNKLLKTSYAMVIAGAIGNMLDRTYNGFVVDFLDFYLYLNGEYYHYPAFNLADSFICCGVALIFFDLFFCKKKG